MASVGRVFCAHCKDMTDFADPPALIRTRIGARGRLSGICKRCGHEVSRFVASETEPTRHAVRVGEETALSLRRASDLLGISRRAIVENLLAEHLDDFVQGQLSEMARAGILSPSECQRREQELETPLDDWERQPSSHVDEGGSWKDLLRRLFGGGE